MATSRMPSPIVLIANLGDNPLTLRIEEWQIVQGLVFAIPIAITRNFHRLDLAAACCVR
jgi:hypothetical protein